MIVIMAWIGLMVLLYLHFFIFGVGSLLSYLLHSAYLLIVPVLLIKFQERANIKERFGLQKKIG